MEIQEIVSLVLFHVSSFHQSEIQDLRLKSREPKMNTWNFQNWKTTVIFWNCNFHQNKAAKTQDSSFLHQIQENPQFNSNSKFEPKSTQITKRRRYSDCPNHDEQKNSKKKRGGKIYRIHLQLKSWKCGDRTCTWTCCSSTTAAANTEPRSPGSSRWTPCTPPAPSCRAPRSCIWTILGPWLSRLTDSPAELSGDSRNPPPQQPKVASFNAEPPLFGGGLLLIGRCCFLITFLILFTSLYFKLLVYLFLSPLLFFTAENFAKYPQMKRMTLYIFMITLSLFIIMIFTFQIKIIMIFTLLNEWIDFYIIFSLFFLFLFFE